MPDELIIEEVVIPRVDSPEAEDGFLLDGFPRTLPQAEALDDAMERLKRELTAVLSIEVPDEEIIRRLSGRRICTKKPATSTTWSSTRRRTRASATRTARR